MGVVIIGTLDTKGTEVGYVRDRLLEAGLDVIVLDAGVLGLPAVRADISRDEVFAAAGTSLAKVGGKGDRGEAVTLASHGATRIVRRLHTEGRVQGVLSLG